MLCGSAMFYYVLDAQLFLHPRLVRYAEHILLMINSFFPHTARTTTMIHIRLLTKCVFESSTYIKRIM
jgi:hypothetical protein